MMLYQKFFELVAITTEKKRNLRKGENGKAKKIKKLKSLKT